jgi:hypothetical protein
MRFRVVRSGRILECLLDRRWSFRENLAVIAELEGRDDLKDCRVYDPRKHLFLDTSCPLRDFGTLPSETFFLY